MMIFSAIRRFLSPSDKDVARAPYLSHYQLVDRDGAVYRESDVPVVYFEDGPAIAKQMLLNRAEPDRAWRLVSADR